MGAVRTKTEFLDNVVDLRGMDRSKQSILLALSGLRKVYEWEDLNSEELGKLKLAIDILENLMKTEKKASK